MVQRNNSGKQNFWFITTLTLTHFAQHFYSGSPILLQSVREDLNLSYFQIGLMTGVSRIISGSLQMGYSVIGRYIPKRVLLAGSNVLISVGCLVIGFARSFLGLVSGSMTASLGVAGEHPAGTSIITNKYSEGGIAEALSKFYGLGYIGNIVSPIILSTIAVLMGWRFSYLFLALIPLATGLNVLYSLRRDPSGGLSLSEGGEGSLLRDIRSSIQVKGAIFIFLAQSFIAGGTGLGVLITWVPQFLRDPGIGLGLNIMVAGIVSAISTLGGVVGTVTIGKLAERFGYLKTAIVCVSFTIVTVYLLTLYSTFHLILVPHLFLIGVSTFSISSLLQAQLADISTSYQRDILIGIYLTVSFGLSSFWSMIMGFLVDIYSFNAMWIMMSTLGFIALIMLFKAYHTIF